MEALNISSILRYFPLIFRLVIFYRLKKDFREILEDVLERYQLFWK